MPASDRLGARPRRGLGGVARAALSLLGLGAILSLAAGGCAGDACFRHTDCASDEVCRSGRCIAKKGAAKDAGAEAGDSATDDASERDGASDGSADDAGDAASADVGFDADARVIGDAPSSGDSADDAARLDAGSDSPMTMDAAPADAPGVVDVASGDGNVPDSLAD